MPTGVSSEVGSVTVAQANASEWHTVSLGSTFVDPIVVVGPPSYAGTDQSTVRVRNVTPTSFEFQIDEWDYLDGAHTTETMAWLVVEAGVHLLPNGAVLVAGKTPEVKHRWTTQALPPVFSATPVVLTQAASASGALAVTTRQRNASAGSFQLKLQKEELGSKTVLPETVHWIAIEQTVAVGVLEATQAGTNFDESWDPAPYAQTYSGAPRVLATMQGHTGGNTCALRYRNANASSVEFLVEEERSRDSEVNHSNEAVGMLLVAPEVTHLGLVPLTE